MVNPLNNGNSDFQSLLHYKVGYQKQYDVNEIALFLNRSPDTIRRYINGTKIMPPDLIRALIRFVLEKNPKDLEFLNFFCLPAGYIPIQSAEYKVCKKDIKQQEIDMSILNGKAIDCIEKAYADGKIDRNEWKAIHKLLTQVRQVAAELDEKIKKEIR